MSGDRLEIPKVPKNEVKGEEMKTESSSPSFEEKESVILCVDCKQVSSRVRGKSAKFRQYTGNPFGLDGIDLYQENYICRSCEKQHKRHNGSRIQRASDKFLSSCNELPCYVCTCCHRMLFQKSVRVLNLSLYDRKDEVVNSCLSDRLRRKMPNGREWICSTCHKDLCKGEVPVQSAFNGLELEEVPPVIKELTSLEVRCISLRLPFMKLSTLRKGGQGKIIGPCVNVPSSLEQITTILPRMPEDIHLILLKLKRKLKFKSHHIFDFIRPHKVTAALAWLKANHPHYKDVIVDELWTEKLKNHSLSDILLEKGQDKTGQTTGKKKSKDKPLPEQDQHACEVDGFSDNETKSRSSVESLKIAMESKESDEAETDVEMRSTEKLEEDVEEIDTQKIASLKIKQEENQESAEKCARKDKPVPGQDECDSQADGCSDNETKLVPRQDQCASQADGCSDNKAKSGSSVEICEQETTEAGEETSDVKMKSAATSDKDCEQKIEKVCQEDKEEEARSAAERDNTESSNDDDKVKAEEMEKKADEVFKERQDEIDRKADTCVEPSSTCLQVEDLEQTIFSIAPGENSIPKYILLDDDFEMLSFPDLFPTGVGCFDATHDYRRKLNLRRYVNQRLLNVDPRFSQNLEYIFAFQYATELKQLHSDMCTALRRVRDDGKDINAGVLKDSSRVQGLIMKDVAYKFMKNVRGTPAYWQQQLFDTLAMLRTFGTPTLFLTLSAAEFLWPSFVIACARRMGDVISEEEVVHMDWNRKAKYLRYNPVTTVQMFQHRVESLFNDFLKSDAAPLGVVKESCIKIEFQARGSPHAHCLLWIKDAPQLNVQSDQEVIAFCDKHVCGQLPPDNLENEEMRNLLLKVQCHVHSPNCRRDANSQCRFQFPRPPTKETLIARPQNDSIEEDVDPVLKRKVLKLVKEATDGKKDVSFDEVLEKEMIPKELYQRCLKESRKGATLVLKREVEDMFVNNYNPLVMKIWKANMDLQFVADPYSAIMYVLSYVMKSEKGMSDTLKSIAKERESEGVKEQMKGISSAFSNKREVSVQEAIMRVLSCWLFRKTTDVIYVSNAEKELRTRVPLSKAALMDLEDNDTDVFMTSIHDRYENRPDHLEHMCLAEFATTYSPSTRRNEDHISSGKQIVLKNELGLMSKRSKPLILRTHSFPEDSSEFFLGKLLLFYPWRKEDSIKRKDETYQERYNSVCEVVETNAKPFNLDRKDIDLAFADYLENGRVETDWDLTHGQSVEEGAPVKQKVSSEGEENNEDDAGCDAKDKPINVLSSLYKTEARKKVISDGAYFEKRRRLNKEQKEIVEFNRKWVKENIARIRRGEGLKGYKVFLSGPGGTGKSTVIELIHRDVTELFRCCRVIDDNVSEMDYNPDDPTSLLTAFTGTASFNINGSTMHSLFQLMRDTVPHEKKCVMMTRLKQLKHVCIDEISMVKKQHLDLINERCSMIRHHNANDQEFGDVAILAVGDLYQLPPVGGRPVFSHGTVMKPADFAPNIWDKFKFHELKQVMRQKDDWEFAMLLNSIRTKKPEENSDEDRKLKARELHLKEEDPGYPTFVLHVYAQNLCAKARNERILNKLDGHMFKSYCKDTVKDDKINLADFILPDKATQTGNLEKVLVLKEGARVMLTNNLDVKDGLTNGAFGNIRKILTTSGKNKLGKEKEVIACVLVEFDHERVGASAKRHSMYKKTFPNCVPVRCVEVPFSIRGSQTVQITRRQIPLALAWAVTIHKTQGMTVDEIVVDMTKANGRYNEGQAYVALSRVTSYEKLHIVNYDRHQIKVSRQSEEEMKSLKERCLDLGPPSVLDGKEETQTAICHLNIHQLRSQEYRKSEDLVMDESIQKCDIVCLTETHLHELDTFSEADVWIKEGGSVHRLERNGEKGGGIVIALRKELKSKRLQLRNFEIEAVALQVVLKDLKRVILVCFYIKPALLKRVVAQEIETIVGTFPQNERVIICGDFNEDLLGKNTHNCIVNNTLLHCGFHQHINQCTTDYGSCLDHFYTRGFSNVVADVQDCYYSDHDFTFVIV